MNKKRTSIDGFEKFIANHCFGRSNIKPFVSITKIGDISFNRVAVEKLNLKQFKCYTLFHNKKDEEIAVMFSPNVDKLCYDLIDLKYNDVQVSLYVPKFLQHIGLDYQSTVKSIRLQMPFEEYIEGKDLYVIFNVSEFEKCDIKVD